MVKIGRTVYNRSDGKPGIVTTIVEKGHLKGRLRIKYRDGHVRFQLQNDIRTRKPPVPKLDAYMDNLTPEQLERVKKTAEMVGLPLRKTAEEMAEAGLLGVEREKGSSD